MKSSAEDVVTIEKALDDSGFFESAEAGYDVGSDEIHVVVHSIAPSPTLDEVAHLIDALETKAGLVDVVWGPQPTPAKIRCRRPELVAHGDPLDDAHAPNEPSRTLTPHLHDRHLAGDGTGGVWSSGSQALEERPRAPGSLPSPSE